MSNAVATVIPPMYPPEYNLVVDDSSLQPSREHSGSRRWQALLASCLSLVGAA